MKHPWIASGEWWSVNDEWWLMGWIDLYGWFMVMVNSGYFMPFIMMNGDKWDVTLWYINIDPENHQFSLETNHPTPSHGRVVMVIYWRICIYIYTYIYTCKTWIFIWNLFTNFMGIIRYLPIGLNFGRNRPIGAWRWSSRLPMSLLKTRPSKLRFTQNLMRFNGI